MAATRSPSSYSTPKYLDPVNGPTCGCCAHCAIDNPYNVHQYGLCRSTDTMVNIRRATKCPMHTPIDNTNLAYIPGQVVNKKSRMEI